MEYVFFDIECACVYKEVAKICVFGYCVCDENFNIVEKKDLLINPNGKFHLTAHGGDGIVLPYNYGDFKNYPDFPAFYPAIKKLLEGKGKLVAGHAAINDVKYLNLETKRYKLPSFEFEFADTQILYMAMSETYDRQTGLDKLTDRFQIEFQAHRAADDAYAAMKVAEAMCAENGCTFSELLKKYGIRFGRIANYEFKNCSSRRGDEYYRRRAEEKEARNSVRVEFHNFVGRTRMRPQSKELAGKRFIFSRRIEENLPLSKRLVGEICRKGGKYSLKIGAANVFVAEENDESVRGETARRLAGEGKNLEIIDLPALYTLLELNE